MRSVFIKVCATALLLQGCDSKPDVVLRDSMKDVVAPQAQIVWDTGNIALNDEGAPDPSKMTDTDWSRTLEAGHRLRDISLALSQAKRLTVARPGDTLEHEDSDGSFNAAQVQRFIDSDLPTFTTMADGLRANADQIIAASNARDAKTLVDASGELVEVCESCHVKFWYPPDTSAK